MFLRRPSVFFNLGRFLPAENITKRSSGDQLISVLSGKAISKDTFPRGILEKGLRTADELLSFYDKND